MAASPTKLTYNGVDFHDLGTVSVLSQQTSYSPDQMPQVETRTITVRIDAQASQAGYNFDTLYAKMQAARTALAVPNKVLVWSTPGATADGATQLERPAIVVSSDMPEDPNGWGVYWQQLNIVFRYELDQSANSGALVATVGSTAIPLGQVHGWKDDFKNSFYSEWKNIRQRQSGNISANGILFVGVGQTGASGTDTRLASVVADWTALKAQLNGKDVRLVYGTVFDQVVKVESFTGDIQDATTGKITWQANFTYTAFPNESGHAGAEFTSALSQDKESGMETLAFSGKVVAGTEALAVSKLSALVTQLLSAYGYSASNATRTDVSKNWVNAEDTSSLNAFLELTFNYSYSRKSPGSIAAYTLTISDQDDLKSGLITRTYSGSVMANGASEAAAYAAALAKARELGDTKHQFRVSASETKADRKMVDQTSAEFLKLDFSYTYQLKGGRIYVELTSSIAEESFAESQERISGYIVALDETTARSNYATLIRTPYAGRLIRSETLDAKRERVQLGTAANDLGSGAIGVAGYSGSGIHPTLGFTPDGKFTRLDFTLNVLKSKGAGINNLKYAVKVESDYVTLAVNTSLEGVWQASQADYSNLLAGTSNSLTDFLNASAAAYGALIRTSYDHDKEQVGAASGTVGVRFACNYTRKMAGMAAILKCQLSEDITYSGIRWVFQQLPDGADRAQNCGTTQGTRTVTGSVTAATEAAALAWIQLQRSNASGLFKTYRAGEQPADGDRYEEPMQVQTSFEFVPLEASPYARGADGNFQVINMSFTFKEVVPDLPSPFS